MKYIAITTFLLVFATVFAGVYFLRKGKKPGGVRARKILRANLCVFVPLLAAGLLVVAPGIIEAAGEQADKAMGMGFIAAAIATGLSTLGAGYAVAVVGSAALGAVSEDESLLGKALIFAGLAEGVAIYGMIVAILILAKL
jgi:V/A-type H+-transporting ATPase subunit K